MSSEPTFMDLVEVHERKWGDKQYPGRPSLKVLLKASIVAAWRIDKRFFFTVHDSMDELNALCHQVITGEVSDNRRLWKLYENQEPAQFRAGVAIVRQAAPMPEVQSLEDTQRIMAKGTRLKPAPALRHAMTSPGAVVIDQEFKKLQKPGRNVTLKPGREAPIFTKDSKRK